MGKNIQKAVSDHKTIEAKSALITGASSGLGEEFARQLAARGYNLFLTARNHELLQQVKQSITSTYNVQVEINPADLSNSI